MPSIHYLIKLRHKIFTGKNSKRSPKNEHKGMSNMKIIGTRSNGGGKAYAATAMSYFTYKIDIVPTVRYRGTLRQKTLQKIQTDKVVHLEMNQLAKI